MYDTERIGKIISDIEKYFRDLEELTKNKVVIRESKGKKTYYELA